MKLIPQKTVYKYLRHNKKFPHVWCPGCSNGIVLGAIIRAIEELQWDKDNITMVSGIGCSSRMPVYIDLNTLHTLHGRAIAFATGIKMYKPEMKVIVVTGDGDSSAIGGNHLIHAARRNIDLTVVVINNNIYGMTGGQYSPTTPKDSIATTMPYGNIDNPFDICELAIGAGASFVARTTAYHAIEAETFIKKGLEHKGFALIDIVSACPTYYGRLNKTADASEMMKQMKERAIPIKDYEKLSEEERKGKYKRGIFKEEKKIEYTEAYQMLVDRLKAQSGAKK